MRALLAVLMCCVAFPVQAQFPQPICGPTAILKETLEKDYKEVETSVGVINGRAYVSVFVSAGGDTWTITLNRADGITCVLADGEGWSQGEMPPAGDPA